MNVATIDLLAAGAGAISLLGGVLICLHRGAGWAVAIVALNAFFVGTKVAAILGASGGWQ